MAHHEYEWLPSSLVSSPDVSAINDLLKPDERITIWGVRAMISEMSFLLVAREQGRMLSMGRLLIVTTPAEKVGRIIDCVVAENVPNREEIGKKLIDDLVARAQAKPPVDRIEFVPSRDDVMNQICLSLGLDMAKECQAIS